MVNPRPPRSRAALPPGAEPRFRSGAVARMVAMPVTTLRVWERRYGIGSAERSASGHRLYSAADVERLAALKRLTDLGHAIGSIAALDLPALQQVSRTHASTQDGAAAESTRAAAPRTAVIIGAALARRLERPVFGQRLARRLKVLAVFESAAAARDAADGRSAQLLLAGEPTLREATPDTLRAAADAWQAARAGVVYGYGTLAAQESHRRAGIAVWRDGPDDGALAAWIDGEAAAPRGQRLPARAAAAQFATGDLLRPPPRRYDDLTLTEIAGLSTSIACECPRHVAALLQQLSQFEAYSAECRNRDAADAELHGYLARVSGSARALFEQALERVAWHEGLVLPAPAAAPAPGAARG